MPAAIAGVVIRVRVARAADESVGAGAQAGGVAVDDRVVGGIGVAVHLLGTGFFENGVLGDESSGDRVVIAGADDVQAGAGVGGLAEEGVGVWPRGRGARR